MLDFRLLVFYTVAKKLSFTKAAAELFITQPAVSRHIQELEQQVGLALFERSGKQISLTRAGEVALRHGEIIQANYRQLEYDLNASLYAAVRAEYDNQYTPVLQTLSGGARASWTI